MTPEDAVHSRETVYKGRVFSVVREQVTLPTGKTATLDVVRHPGASAVLPMRDDNTVILLHQYRRAVGGYIWEIPAGTLEENEAPLSCAQRELVEETGFSAGSWEKLGEIVPVPGYSDERIHLFLAKDLSPAQQNLDKDEVLDVHQMPLQKVLEMIRTGEIQDSKTINGLLMARFQGAISR